MTAIQLFVQKHTGSENESHHNSKTMILNFLKSGAGMKPSLRRTAGLLILGGLLLWSGNASAQAHLKGAGSTFAYPVYSKWFAAYLKKDETVAFEYGYVGSSEGIRRVLAQEVDFGATDAVLSDAQMQAEGKGLLHIPTFAGAVAVTYNLPGNPVLKLDGETLAHLFLGNITKWNDERVAKLNPDITLPDLAVTVVRRADGSGTTSVFTGYLSKVSQEWKEKVGAGKDVKWPTGKAAKGNKGVAELTKATPGAVAYAEHAAVAQVGLPDAALKNRAGKFTSATVDSIRASMATAVISEDLRFSLTDAPGETAYPIASATWLLVPAKGKDLAKNRKMVQFLTWALTAGDEIVQDKGCAPLPPELKRQVMTMLKRVQTP